MLFFCLTGPCMEKLELICLELLSACSLNNRGQAHTTSHPTTHTHTHTHTHTPPPLLSSLLPFFPELALFRLFLFFPSEKGDSMTAFPASRGLEPGERKLCYSLRLQLWEEVTTSSPDSVHTHTCSGRYTHTHMLFRTWPQQQQGLGWNGTACNAAFVFKIWRESWLKPEAFCADWTA